MSVTAPTRPSFSMLVTLMPSSDAAVATAPVWSHASRSAPSGSRTALPALGLLSSRLRLTASGD
jgi:hypothetical protein